eukprot:TRINITY_DN37643_c0_g1_i2.p1 TRINITY_DN37643_c0_g1~~TRINITY_DN37643_c0_g1_i2.p1  ORF type:complete len:78 (-),score=3.58 TRINITY_DN37643_c0_g1_i2:4-237(-)
MGICRCPKRQNSELFCFVHRKRVCTTCILDHPTCYIADYSDWLVDGEFEEMKCSACQGVVSENENEMFSMPRSCIRK